MPPRLRIPFAQSPPAHAAQAAVTFSSARVSIGELLTPHQLAAIKVDAGRRPAGFSPVNLRHFISKLRRLDLTQAAREATALKDQFRREDRELLAQGRGDEIAARNRRLMGIREGAKSKLVGFNGVRFE